MRKLKSDDELSNWYKEQKQKEKLFQQKLKIELEKINPNYEVIERHLHSTVNRKSFEKNLEYILRRKEDLYTEFKKISKADHNLYFFWVYYFDAYEHSEENKKFENHKFWRTYNNQLEELKNKLKELYKNDFENPQHDREYELTSISIHLTDSKSKASTFTISSTPLLLQIYLQLNDWLQKLPAVNTPNVKNNKTYLGQFIANTHPLFSYLQETHFKDKSKNKTYEFMAEFLKTLGCDLIELYPQSILLPSKMIKDIYQKRSKTTS